MKIFCLYYDESTVPIAICKDKWLLELFIVQRNLNVDLCSIRKDKDGNYRYNDRYLVYYYGHAITNLEARYVEMNYAEAESDIDIRIHDLRTIIAKYQKDLKPKRIKELKKTIKALEKIEVRKSKKYAKYLLETIETRPREIYEYLEALDLFQHCLDHDYLH